MKFLAFVFLIALIIGAVIYIVSTVKKARNRGETYEDTQETPRDPFNSLRWLLPDYLNQREKKGTWVSIAVIVVSAYVAVGVIFTPGTDPNQCGDYTLKNGSYIHTEGRGDYDKEGTSYFYVGCKKSRGGWFYGFPGFSSGSGSGD